MRNTRAASFAIAVLVALLGCRSGPPADAPAPASDRAVSLAVGAVHACAVLEGGRVACWGSSSNGRLGDGMSAVDAEGAPGGRVFVADVASAVSVAAGGDHTCALLASGAVWCWGSDRDGQLGHADRAGRSRGRPAPVPGLSGVERLALGWSYSCALLAGGAVRCWGSRDVAAPASAIADGPPTAARLATDRGRVCALSADGGRRCWGRGAFVAPADLGPVVDLAFGSAHTCALERGGAVRCWGMNDRGQLAGTPGRTPLGPIAAVPVEGLGDVTRIVAGYHHNCALRADGTVACWGDNEYGQLGVGTAGGSGAPAPVPGLADIVEIGAGQSHTCARTRGGQVLCWGWNWLGQLGDGSKEDRPSPVPVVL